MGITGLLSRLPRRSMHVSEYAGKTVGVDGYVWLFQAISAYRHTLRADNLGTSHVGHFLKHVQVLLQHGVTPIIVFDGVFPPARHSKQRTGAEPHHADRRTPTAAAAAPAPTPAHALDVLLPFLAKIVMEAFQLHPDPRVQSVRFLTAPYEADTQLAYLARLHPDHPDHIHAVITEDSDQLAFGSPRVLFKFNHGTGGWGDEVCIYDVLAGTPSLPPAGTAAHAAAAASAVPAGSGSSSNSSGGTGGQGRGNGGEGSGMLEFGRGWSLSKFQLMCVLSGCEYLDSVKGVGLVRAHVLAGRYTTWQQAVLQLWQDQRAGQEGRRALQDYMVRVQRALWFFSHAVVYSPKAGTCVYLTPLPPNGLVMVDCGVGRKRRAGHGGGGGGESGVDSTSEEEEEEGEQEEGGWRGMGRGRAREDKEAYCVLGKVLKPEVVRDIAEGRLNPQTRQPFVVPVLQAV